MNLLEDMDFSRRRFLPAAVATLASSQFVASAASGRSRKKGWAGGDAEMHEKFGVHWYYNWMSRAGLKFLQVLKNQSFAHLF